MLNSRFKLFSGIFVGKMHENNTFFLTTRITETYGKLQTKTSIC